jgi:hypothetical protein
MTQAQRAVAAALALDVRCKAHQCRKCGVVIGESYYLCDDSGEWAEHYRACPTMTTYFLHYNQNGGITKFGAEDNSTAQCIASALLRRMTTDRGGVLYTKDAEDRADGSLPYTTVMNFDRCGGITVNGIHACPGGCR